jgi:DNA-directed RNA polymerase subunit F
MAEVKKVWNAEGNRLYLGYPSQEFEKLEDAIYNINVDDFGRFYLVKNSDGFKFDYKLYGLETELVDRVIKTYTSTTHGNLGVLLNGLKGTGKTVSSKIIANRLNQPIILVDSAIRGIHKFLTSIPQNITIFIDEYEKVFGESTDMLTIMDGALNSEFRRVFLLTTNELYVDRNLIQRPGRIRYLKKFEDLKPNVVEEIVDDCLVDKKYKQECINFISNLETITVDIVKAILTEVNIHDEGPNEFEHIFNVKKLKGKYNLLLREDDGSLVQIAKSVAIYPRPMFNDEKVGYHFEVDGDRIGIIRRVINFNTLEVEPYEDDNGNKIGFDSSLYIKVEDADIVNYSFAYDGYGTSMITKPKDIVSGDYLNKLVDRIENHNSDSNKIKKGQLISPGISIME